MELKKLISIYGNRRFIIEEDLPEVGAYLYIYDDNKCIYDCLQDNIEICKEVAFESYHVPFDSWKKIDA